MGRIGMNRALVIILAAVALDAVGIGLIFPILPGLLRNLVQGSDVALLVGLTLSVYALMQFIMSPVLGALSDRYGRRPVLLISLAGAAVDYLVMTVAPEFWMLVVGRAVAGMTSANMAVATAYLTDISTPEQRPRRFGYIHALFGIGFIVGPVLGGFLGEIWIRAPFLAAAVLNFANFALALVLLPESRPGRKTAFEWKTLNPFGPVRWALSYRALIPFLAIFLILNTGGQVYGTIWALYGLEQFGWTPISVGLSLAAYGALHAFAQGVLVGPVVKWMGERNALLFGLASESVSLAVLAFLTQGWIVFLIMPLFAMGGIGFPALQSLATATVDADHQGRLQGVLSSIMSLAAIYGPILYSAIYFASKSAMPGLVWLVTIGIYVIVLPLALPLKRRAAPA